MMPWMKQVDGYTSQEGKCLMIYRGCDVGDVWVAERGEAQTRAPSASDEDNYDFLLTDRTNKQTDR